MSCRKKPISKDRLDRNRNVLSESIVQYYLKHGQNRDLERYLRLRGSRSSSDTSLPHHPSDFITDRVHKSLENLSKLKDEAFDREKEESVEEKSEISEKSGENLESEKSKENIDKTNNIKVLVKQQSDNKSENKKNPFNFNVESVIEISVPQLPLQLPAPPSLPVPILEVPASTSKEIISYSCVTQTQQNQGTNYDLESSNVETPIKPIVKAPKSKRSIKENLENISPTSSVLSQSNKQKLEWDSLGDVGYDLGHDINQKYSLFNPNESEKRALQTYFGQRGINFEDKVVLLTNKDKLKSLQEQEAEKLGEIRKNKEKWEKIYDKYKEKYQKPQLEFSDLIPDAQSTPRIPELSVREKPEMEPKNKDEKSSQTSLIKNMAKSTQVEESDEPPKLPPRHSHRRKLKHTKDSSSFLELFNSSGLTEEASPGKKDFQPVEVAESFVFIAGSSQEKSESGVTQLSTTNTSRTVSSVGGEKTEISTFDEELKIAIALLNSLVDSKHMNAELKKSLASKVIQKIIRIQSSKSIQTSTSNAEEEIYSEPHESTNPNSSRRTSFFSNSSESRTETQKHLERKQAQNLEVQKDLKDNREVKEITKKPADKMENEKDFEDRKERSKEEERKNPPKSKENQDDPGNNKRKPKLKELCRKISKSQESQKIFSKSQESREFNSKSQESNSKSQDSHKFFSKSQDSQEYHVKSPNSHKNPQRSQSLSNSQNTTENSSILEVPISSKATAGENSTRSRSSSESRKKVLHEFLKPLTHSEFDYQNQKKLEKAQKDKEKKKQESENSQKTGSQLVDFLKEEKKSQLNWIEREIDHLKNLRELLVKNGDLSSRNTTLKSSILESSEKTEKSEKSSILDSKNGNRVYENLEGSSLVQDKSEGSKKKQNKLEKSSPAFSSSKTSSKETSAKDSSLEKIPGKSRKPFNDWDSHTNMKKIIKNRSKLETPETSEQTDESLVSFINKRKDKFLEKYEKQLEKVEHSGSEENFYTKPYNSQDDVDNGHYSEPNERRPPIIQRRITSQYLEQKAPQHQQINGSTSLASSEAFVSSNSISIPIENSQSNSTSNPYNYRERRRIQRRIIGTQTTDSISKTHPIFENKLEASVETLSHTKLIDQTKNHKQMQTNPKSIKYTLTFERNSRVTEEIKFSSLPQKLVTEKSSKEILNRMNSNSLDNRVNNEKQEVLEEVAEEELNLEKCLTRKRPNVWRKFEERRQCLQELRRLR